MKNRPEDEDFIKRANEDPNWPDDIDKPCDWNKVSVWQKLWFKFGDALSGLFWVLVFCGLSIALIEFIDAGDSIDDPSCTQSSRGCYDD